MSATVELTRPFRLADAVWPYQIVLDGQAGENITTRGNARLRIEAGTHTLQIRSRHVLLLRLGLASPTVTFEVTDGGTAEFVCHSRPFVQILFWLVACLLGDRSRWLVLRRTNAEARAGAR
jgi:hypothetical protein